MFIVVRAVNFLVVARLAILRIVSSQPGAALLTGVVALVPLVLASHSSRADTQAGAFPNGYYTAAQAEAGKDVFDKVCAICHGDNMQGKVGPALAGQQFLSVSQFQQVTAYYFYHFMSKHMPLNAPGSLTPTQYLDLLAYMLQANGYASGSHQLTPDSNELKEIKIEPQH